MFDHLDIESKWHQWWLDQKLFQKTTGSSTQQSEKIYILFAFPYPSGDGLHVGHVESKTALDILARFYRMKGKQVFFPVGWDAFGLPAENYAIKTGVHPAETTKKAIDTFRSQIKRIGISYDWQTELATSHPEYYKWTQWIFLQLYKKGLAYKKPGSVNWCESCQTVLANEQVVEGACERCDCKVIQKQMDQWYFKITDYTEELISGLEQVDWPEPTKRQQLEWIGKREGVSVEFQVLGESQVASQSQASSSSRASSLSFKTEVETFTTRLDTIFGVTFVVVAPEKIEAWIKQGWQAPGQVKDYISQAMSKTEEERKVGEKDKTGVDTGLKAVNPVNGEEVPVWVADYVLADYGTGVVMGVPAHDERDFGFANKFGLPVKRVVSADGSIDADLIPFTEYGALINSGDFDGLRSEKAIEKIAKTFPKKVKKLTTYKLRDWLISRQRYWGTPIPIVYDPKGKPHPVKEEHLPWLLPKDVDYNPKGKPPLASSRDLQKRVEKLYGKGWIPEYDTMDTFVDSSWYFLRYPDARNTQKFTDPAKLAQWLPVDFYMIGPEHIVLHLLYSRFFTKFLRDEGYLDFDEPFIKMRHQGMILGPDGKKMSKSKGNVINPDDVVKKFGADTLRLYEMFMGPLEADKAWDERAVVGIYRFLQRAYALVTDSLASVTQGPVKSAPELERKLHQTVKKLSHDLPKLKFNTAIAALMELVNFWEKSDAEGSEERDRSSGASGARVLKIDDRLIFVKLLAPLAPFLAEEMSEILARASGRVGVGQAGGEHANDQSQADNYSSIHLDSWPDWDPELVKEEAVVVPVQVNGKLRGEVTISAEHLEDKDFVLKEARALPSVAKYLKDGQISQEIYVAGKIINFVVE